MDLCRGNGAQSWLSETAEELKTRLQGISLMKACARMDVLWAGIAQLGEERDRLSSPMPS